MINGRFSRPDRGDPTKPVKLCFGPFRFDPVARRLYRDGVEVHLVPKAAAVLGRLLANPGRTVGKKELLDRVWEGTHVTDECLTQTLSTIRLALGDVAHSPEYIKTVPGKGYRFIAPVSSDGPLSRQTPGRATGRVSRSASTRRRPLLAWAVAALSLAIVAGMLLPGSTPATSTPSRRVVRFTERLPAGRTLRVSHETKRRWGSNAGFLALSPDGRYLAYVARELDGDWQLYLRSLNGDDGAARVVPGSEGARGPFFSPDGRWVGFEADGRLYRAHVDDGLPQLIVETVRPGASWGPGDEIAYDLGYFSGIGITSPSGGAHPEIITSVDIGRRENGHRDPSFLPDGSALLYTNWIGGGRDTDTVSAFTLATGDTKIILERASAPRFMDPGYLTFVREGQLQVQAFDAAVLEVVGIPVAYYSTERGMYDVSRGGDLAYIPMPRNQIGSELVAADRAGRTTFLASTQHIAAQPSVSPDGGRLAVLQLEPDGEQNIWILDTVGKTAPIQVTSDGNSAIAQWSPDGRAVIYNSDQRGPWETFRVAADGTGEPEVLIEGDSAPYDLHPVLPHFVFVTEDDLWVLDLEAETGPRRLFAEGNNQGGARFSPDGKWLLYWSHVEGEREIFVRSYPDLANRVKVSRGGGLSARWSPDGREIFYVTGENMMSVAVEYDRELRAGVPRILFELGRRFLLPTGGTDFDVLPDGRFVLGLTPEEEVHTEIKVVLNFVEEVKERIPPGGLRSRAP